MWYVVQTMTGREQELVDLVRRMLPEDIYRECFYLKRQLLKRLGGEWLEVTEKLFPAYVFLDLDNPEPVFYQLKRVPKFTKLLGDNQGAFIALEDEEARYFQLLCRNGLHRRLNSISCKPSRSAGSSKNNYLVRVTKVYLGKNGEVRNMDGPLEQFQDKIVRLNLRKRYAVIELTIRGEKQTALLGIKLEKD